MQREDAGGGFSAPCLICVAARYGLITGWTPELCVCGGKLHTLCGMCGETAPLLKVEDEVLKCPKCEQNASSLLRQAAAVPGKPTLF
jgi:hypothetical protein